jgi:pimeloyl-ACP methyl ester carboxylesterase
MPDADRWLQRADARLRWRVQGTGPALLLLHGWALDLRLWDLLLAPLAERFTLLRFDRRGFGLSSGEASLRHDAQDALALLDAAGIRRCAVIGMSQGARVAAALARDAAARISHVVLDGAPALENVLDEDLEQEIPLARYQAVLARDGITALRAAVSRHALLQLARPQAAAAALLGAMLADYPGTDLLHHAPPRQATAQDPARTRRASALLGITQPTLVINGERDSALRRRIGAALTAHIAGARHLLLADAGHLACLDDASAYARGIGDFVAGATTDV